MYSKEEIWNSLAHEFNVVKHLATKVPAGKEHHKPTEKQRTTLELMQFLSFFALGGLHTILEGNYDAHMKMSEEAKAMKFEDFASAMDAELAAMKPLFEKLTASDEEMQKQISIWGRTSRKGIFVLDLLKMLSAYKMQLFLYVKQSGAHDISTANVWAGMDMPAPKAH